MVPGCGGEMSSKQIIEEISKALLAKKRINGRILVLIEKFREKVFTSDLAGTSETLTIDLVNDIEAVYITEIIQAIAEFEEPEKPEPIPDKYEIPKDALIEYSGTIGIGTISGHKIWRELYTELSFSSHVTSEWFEEFYYKLKTGQKAQCNGFIYQWPDAPKS